MGVYYDARRSKWVARGVRVDGKRPFLGRFTDEKAARLAYDLHESARKHKTTDVVAQPLVIEQTGSDGLFPQGMIKRSVAWIMDRFQKRRTDGSERV